MAARLIGMRMQCLAGPPPLKAAWQEWVNQRHGGSPCSDLITSALQPRAGDLTALQNTVAASLSNVFFLIVAPL